MSARFSMSGQRTPNAFKSKPTSLSLNAIEMVAEEEHGMLVSASAMAGASGRMSGSAAHDSVAIMIASPSIDEPLESEARHLPPEVLWSELTETPIFIL